MNNPTTIPNCFYRISIKALILDETRTKFLVVQEDNGKWEFPGGGLDWGDTPQSGLVRDLKVEMGLSASWIDPKPSYFLTQQKSADDIWIANVFFEVKVQNLNFTPSEECVALQFVTKEEALELHAFSNVHIFARMFEPENHQ